MDKRKWDFETCKTEALKYKNRKDFKEYAYKYFKYAQRNKITAQICSHMELLRKPNNYYTYDKCVEITSKYYSLKEFTKNEAVAYGVILKNDWQSILKNLERVGSKLYTYEECMSFCGKVSSISELLKLNRSMYNKIVKKSWLKDAINSFLKV